MVRRWWHTLPKLIRFMLSHFANGVVLGWSAGLLAIWFDIAGIGALLAAHNSAALTALFFAKSGLYFGALAMGVAVMNMGKRLP